MLCCVSRKASPRSNNQNNENHENHENHKKSTLHPDQSSSSGISSSSLGSSDNFDSSVTSGLTSSSSSNTSGFSSSPIVRVFGNSSSDSITSECATNFDESSDFLANNSSDIRAPGQINSDTEFLEAPKRLQTFSSPARRDNLAEYPSVGVDSFVRQESATKDEPTELLPCAICARTFKPQSLEKHSRVCELAAIKKRKPFDSAKQRIQGTELAEFMPKETAKRKAYQPDEKIINGTNKGSWKQTHDEFLQAIRAARGETIESTPQRQVIPPNNVTVGVPTRPNEKGMCPTCHRQFSIKSYERHVAWCKERATRVPMNAATNIAKERLEARMKYRAPALKNRRITNREKYSPLSAVNLTSFPGKSNNGNLGNQRAKETVSTPNCNNNSKGGNENATGSSQKSTVNTRRSGQNREGISSGPMKSRLSDRSSRPPAPGEIESGTKSNCPSPRQNSSRTSSNVFHRLTRHSPTRTNFSTSPTARSVGRSENSANVFNEIDEDCEKMEEHKRTNVKMMKNRRHGQNIVHARSRGNPRINDIMINDDVMGMTVQPCVRKKNQTNEGEFVTWKKIGEQNLRNNELLKFNSIRDSKSKQEPIKSEEIDRMDIIDEKSNSYRERSMELENMSWTSEIEKLDRTYLIRESLDAEIDVAEFLGRRKRRPVIDSPRVQFYYDKKSIERNFFGNVTNEFRDNNYPESISVSSHGRLRESEKKVEDDLSEIPTFSGRPELEPLNLVIIENEDNPEWSETSGSEQSVKSSLATCRSKLTKNTPKLRPFSETASLRVESLNFADLRENSDENSSINFFEDSKNDKNENIKILDTSRSSKSTGSSRNKRDKISTKKIKSIIGEESIIHEASNFSTWGEKNPEKQFSDDIDSKVDENSEILQTPRSSKSTESTESKCDKLLTKKMSITRSIVENELIRNEPIYFGSYDEESREKSPEDTDVETNKDESLQSSERSLIGKKSSKIYGAKLTKKSSNVKSIIGKESFSIDSLDFRSADDKSCDNLTKDQVFDEIDLKIDTDEAGNFLETSRSLESKVSPKMSCDDLLTTKMAEMRSIVANLNFESYDEKSGENLPNNDSTPDIDLRIHSEEGIKISRSFGSTVSLGLNCRESLTNENIESSIVKELKADEPLNDKFDGVKIHKKSSYREIVDQTGEDKTKVEQNTGEIVKNKSNDRNKKTVESLCEKNDKKIDKSDENENALSKIKNEAKMMNYQRCGTYVIDKKVTSKVDAKHQAPDDFLEDKPIPKRRKTESVGSKDFFNSDEPMVKKSVPAEIKEEKSTTSVHENLMSDSKKYIKEAANESKVEKNEDVRKISEKYVNKKFVYDSDETLVNENFLKDHESSLRVEEELTPGTEVPIHDSRDKAFPDSHVRRENHSFRSTFPPIVQKKPEVQSSSESRQRLREKNSIARAFSRQQEIPEVQKVIQSARELGEKDCLENIFSTGQETTPEIKKFPEIESKSRDENAVESIFSKNLEIPEVDNSEMREKSREKTFITSSLSGVKEKLEVQTSLEMRRKLREKMKLLRGSTNNLIASTETSGDVIIEENSSMHATSLEAKSTREIEEETIREIDFGSVGKIPEIETSYGGLLPEIPIDRIIAKNGNPRDDKKFMPLDGASFFWQRATRSSNAGLINLDASKFHRVTKIPSNRLANVGNLPPVVPIGKEKRRTSDRDSRGVWNNYVRRHPDFDLVLTSRTGSCSEYDPFLIAERQMNDLLSDTCSEQSLTDSSLNRRKSSSPILPNYPLSHSSAFVKYPDPVTSKVSPKLPEKRVSLIAPPTEFDDFSSDSTETNSLSREIQALRDTNLRSRDNCHENDERRKNTSRNHVLGRRMIIDKSKALGTKESHDDSSAIRLGFESTQSNDKVRKNFEKTAPKVGRSNSVRTQVSGPKVPERKSNSSSVLSSNKTNTIKNSRNNNYASLSGSNVSLSSIVSSEIDVKRSNSLFDELASSYDDDASGIYPSLRSLLKNDSLSVNSPVQSNRPRNGQISDEEFSSPDSLKRRQEHNKLSADSAYSSLNRKYSNHGRSTNDMAGRQDEDSPLRHRDVDNATAIARSKMSKFCHECGSKFPETAKFCCECGIRRLVL